MGNGPVNSLAGPETGATRRGQAALTVRRVAGKSAVVSAFARDPLKLLTPVSRADAVWACLSSFGGGMVAGDETLLDLSIEDGASAYVGTQASTKVYRNPARRACGHRTQARLGENSLLVLAPDVVQAFADSAYRQVQAFDLAPTASLVLVDWLNSGRSECGEHWAFRRFESRNTIRVAGRRRLVDALVLDADSGTLAGPGRLGSWRCLATVALIGPILSEDVSRIDAEIRAMPVDRSAAVTLSASRIPDGMVIRLAGREVEPVRMAWQRLLTPLASRLGDCPWSRKG
jgi:urease accessory protein